MLEKILKKLSKVLPVFDLPACLNSKLLGNGLGKLIFCFKNRVSKISDPNHVKPVFPGVYFE